MRGLLAAGLPPWPGSPLLSEPAPPRLLRGVHINTRLSVDVQSTWATQHQDSRPQVILRARPPSSRITGDATLPVESTDENIVLYMSVLRAIAVFLCGLLSLHTCRAQVILPGPCPDIAPLKVFEPSRYLGKWYEYEKYFAIFEAGGKCITADYSLADGGAIGVVNKQINIYTGKPSQIKGQAVPESQSQEAKLLVRFPSLPVSIDAPYWVIDTDYDNYSLVWGCLQLGPFHLNNAWILTRKRKPGKEVLQKVYDIANANKIDKSYFLRTDQKNCPEDA
ncbi:unnamed protein product, partial [Brenthis ino]